MKSFFYRTPNDIPVHFFGETLIPVHEYVQKKKCFQLICFLIFHMITNKESKLASFSIKTTNRFQKLRIQLFNVKKVIFEIFENSIDEWVVYNRDTETELLDFTTAYIVYSLQAESHDCIERKKDC